MLSCPPIHIRERVERKNGGQHGGDHECGVCSSSTLPSCTQSHLLHHWSIHAIMERLRVSLRVRPLALSLLCPGCGGALEGYSLSMSLYFFRSMDTWSLNRTGSSLIWEWTRGMVPNQLANLFMQVWRWAKWSGSAQRDARELWRCEAVIGQGENEWERERERMWERELIMHHKLPWPFRAYCNYSKSFFFCFFKFYWRSQENKFQLKFTNDWCSVWTANAIRVQVVQRVKRSPASLINQEKHVCLFNNKHH